jgi:hypothetical protein
MEKIVKMSREQRKTTASPQTPKAEQQQPDGLSEPWKRHKKTLNIDTLFRSVLFQCI